ncbi:MAG: hypothetical protein AAGG01_13930 [Planctomycetota bacterium]
MGKRNTDDPGPQPPEWLEGEWLTWWDGRDTAEQPWALHLVKLDDGEHRFWICRGDNEAQRIQFDSDDAETLLRHLGSALELTRESA